jgi:hypothetical protein
VVVSSSLVSRRALRHRRSLSRDGLSDLAMEWMIKEAMAIEHPLIVDMASAPSAIVRWRSA